METLEKRDSSIDFDFINKYIRDDSDANNKKFRGKNEKQFSWKEFKTNGQGSVEVFGNIGEGGIDSENLNFHKRQEEKNESFEESDEKVESISKHGSSAKQEFLKHLEDDSLSIDTCSHINHDWRRK